MKRPLLFKVDENLPGDVVTLLSSCGHDALSVLDQGLQGCPDDSLAEICQTEGRILVSLDLDFSDLRAFPPAHFAGLIVLRLSRQDIAHVMRVMR